MSDRSLHYAGNRIGVLLIHGLGGTPVEMRSVAKGLHRAGYTVHCCQLAGHCGTEQELKASRWQDWALSVEQGLEQLAGCDTVLAGGLSMGGLMALDLAHQRPERINGVMLFAPTFRHDGWAIPWYSFLLNVLIDTPVGRAWRFVEAFPFGIKDERTRNIVVRAMKAGNSAEGGSDGTPSQSIKQFWKLIRRVRKALPAIRTPALIVHARSDDVASLRSNAMMLQARLGGLAETLVLDDSYHIVTVDRQRDILIERAVAYVAWIDQHKRKAGAAERLRLPVAAA